MAGNKLRLKTVKTDRSKNPWEVVVTCVNGCAIHDDEPKRRVSLQGLIVNDIAPVEGQLVELGTRSAARNAVRNIQRRFPNTEYVGGLH